ncbi:MAG: hypothetical protein AAFZ65_13930, partial [Planctomycetota bacterium]
SQHGSRANWPFKVLVWAANDRMARFDMIAQSAVWQMEYHHGPGGRLDGLRTWATNFPGVAGEFGRATGWIADAMAHWYAVEHPDFRDHLDPWFEELVEAMDLLRTPLGIFYGNRTSKIIDYYEFNEQYAIIQWYEHAIGLHGIATVLESWADDPATAYKLGEYLVDGTLAVHRYGWKQGTTGTWEQQAVASIDPSQPAFATLAAIPTEGFGGGPVNDQLAGPIGYSLPYADPSEAAELNLMAQSLTGDLDPLAALTALYPYWLAIENRAPLLAWLQWIDTNL